MTSHQSLLEIATILTAMSSTIDSDMTEAERIRKLFQSTINSITAYKPTKQHETACLQLQIDSLKVLMEVIEKSYLLQTTEAFRENYAQLKKFLNA